MVTQQRKTKSAKYLTVPTRPVIVDRDRSITGILEKMEGAGLGARALAEAHRIWLDALGDNTTIYIAAGNGLIPAGMRRLLAYVIKNRFVDVLVVSGEMLFHDLHETLGRNHFQAHPSMDDEELESSAIERNGDILANSDEYREADEWIGGFSAQIEQRAYSGREFLHLLGRELAEIATEDGVITSAYKSRIPIFCPDIGNSEICVGMAQSRFEKKTSVSFDLAQDTLEMMHIAQKSRSSCLLTIGEVGSSQEYIRLTDVALNIIKATPRGHKYAVTIAPETLCASGRTNGALTETTQLFGRLAKNAATAFVRCDATIALPLIVTALSQTAAKYQKGRKRPNFAFTGREMAIEIP
ncbi:MAG: deoxyhypusine synthase family protein [Pyrinomonadaceae bacterium]|nr:deoxyhypusine synthase family protein [Pyrinomonadaceae bacterium]